MTAKGTGLIFGNENILKLDSDDGCTIYDYVIKSAQTLKTTKNT